MNLSTYQPHAVRECKLCGAEIAWLRSKRTGRSYPADALRIPNESLTRMYMDNLRVAPWRGAHKCKAVV